MREEMQFTRRNLGLVTQWHPNNSINIYHFCSEVRCAQMPSLCRSTGHVLNHSSETLVWRKTGGIICNYFPLAMKKHTLFFVSMTGKKTRAVLGMFLCIKWQVLTACVWSAVSLMYQSPASRLNKVCLRWADIGAALEELSEKAKNGQLR